MDATGILTRGDRAFSSVQQLGLGARLPHARRVGWRCRRVGDGADGALTVAMMPKNKGNPYFVSCRQGAEEPRQGARRQAALGRPDRDRSGQAERGGRGLDHARRRRDRGQRREQRGDLDRAAEGPRQAASRSSPGTPTPSRTRATSSSTRPRRRASRRRCSATRAASRRRGRVRDHHRVADRRQPERVDRDQGARARREVPRPEARRHPAQRRRSQRQAFDETQTS